MISVNIKSSHWQVTHQIKHSPYTSWRTCFGMSNSGNPNLLKQDVCLYNSLQLCNIKV